MIVGIIKKLEKADEEIQQQIKGQMGFVANKISHETKAEKLTRARTRVQEAISELLLCG